MYRMWPVADPAPLDDAGLIELYRPSGPVLRVNFVTSVDGAVEVEGYSEGLQTPADQRVFQLLRMFADGLLVGAGTLRHEGYGAIRLDAKRRAWRAEHGLDPYPRLVVVSHRLDLEPTNPALREAPRRPAILTTADSPADRRAALSAVADVLVHGEREVDLAAGLARLRAGGMTHVLCEGGPHLFGALTAADLVDEVCLTVSPMLAGPGAGRITAGDARGAGTSQRSTAGPAAGVRGLALASALTDDGTLLLRYARNARMTMGD
jgi:riboflavin biosynthesis pyrimidine reductase